ECTCEASTLPLLLRRRPGGVRRLQLSPIALCAGGERATAILGSAADGTRGCSASPPLQQRCQLAARRIRLLSPQSFLVTRVLLPSSRQPPVSRSPWIRRAWSLAAERRWHLSGALLRRARACRSLCRHRPAADAISRGARMAGARHLLRPVCRRLLRAHSSRARQGPHSRSILWPDSAAQRDTRRDS